MSNQPGTNRPGTNRPGANQPASDQPASPATLVRSLVRRSRSAALATALAKDGARPYVSLVTTACDVDGAPILLFSRLSDHTRNLDADPRASLLFEDASHLENPQTGPRVSLVGRIGPSAEPRHARRFLERHPAAQLYAGFGDFGFYRFSVERAHLVGGFAQARWVDGRDLAVAPGAAAAIAACEESVIDHMNQDHGEALRLYANVLLGRPGRSWRMIGLDTDGIDLRLGRRTVARLDFETPVADAGEVRKVLVDLAARARRAAAR
jgi:putative heme iron utilization protein